MKGVNQEGRELIAEALRLYMATHEANAKKALDDDDSERFHSYANRVLSAKLVLRQVTGKVK